MNVKSWKSRAHTFVATRAVASRGMDGFSGNCLIVQALQHLEHFTGRKDAVANSPSNLIVFRMVPAEVLLKVKHNKL